MKNYFPLLFWRHGRILEVQVPHNIDKEAARKAMLTTFKREDDNKFHLEVLSAFVDGTAKIAKNYREARSK